MSLKKITSLTMLLSMLVMVYTGIMLFVAPPGRVAKWSNWELLGLSKDEYASLHITFMVLFIVMTILHVFYNWKPMTSYMKNSMKQMIVFTKEMVVAVILSLLFIIGTLAGFSPFSNFLEFQDDVKNSWEKDLGTAPYSHAESSSLEEFSKKLALDISMVKKILSKNKFEFTSKQSISQIAKQNNVSPQKIFTLLKKDFQKKGEKIVTFTGMGKKTVLEVAQILGLSSQELIKKLNNIGIEAKENDKFKTLAESYDLSPKELLTKLGYKK